MPEQAEALEQPGVLDGRSLVFSAPTSAGKSAVAEVLALRCLCSRRTADKIVLLVLPFVSLCAEKAAHLERLLKPLDKCAGSLGMLGFSLRVSQLLVLGRGVLHARSNAVPWRCPVLPAGIKPAIEHAALLGKSSLEQLASQFERKVPEGLHEHAACPLQHVGQTN